MQTQLNLYLLEHVTYYKSDEIIIEKRVKKRLTLKYKDKNEIIISIIFF